MVNTWLAQARGPGMGPGQGLPVSVLCSWDHFCEEGPVHCRMLSSITGLYPPDASSSLPAPRDKLFPTLPSVPEGGQNQP